MGLDSFSLVEGANRKQQIPFGDDNKKGNGNCNSNCNCNSNSNGNCNSNSNSNGNGNCNCNSNGDCNCKIQGSFATLRMTTGGGWMTTGEGG